MQDHGVASLDVRHRGTDLVHPASVLMAERVGKLRAHGCVPLTFHDVQVGAAHPSAADLDDHVERANDRWLWHLLDHWVLVISMQTDGSHLLLLLPNADTRIAVMQHVTAHPGVRLQTDPCESGPAEVGTYRVDLEAAAGESIHQQRIVISARQAQLDMSRSHAINRGARLERRGKLPICTQSHEALICCCITFPACGCWSSKMTYRWRLRSGEPCGGST